MFLKDERHRQLHQIIKNIFKPPKKQKNVWLMTHDSISILIIYLFHDLKSSNDLKLKPNENNCRPVALSSFRTAFCPSWPLATRSAACCTCARPSREAPSWEISWKRRGCFFVVCFMICSKHVEVFIVFFPKSLDWQFLLIFNIWQYAICCESCKYDVCELSPCKVVWWWCLLVTILINIPTWQKIWKHLKKDPKHPL